jgi:hypothetical protein
MKLNNLKYIIVLILILSSPSLLTYFLWQKTGLSVTIFDLLLLSFIIIMGITSAKSAVLKNDQRALLFFFIFVLIYLLIIWNIGTLLSGSKRAIFKYFLVAPFLIFILNSYTFSLQKFINYYLFVTFALSLLSIIQYIGVPLGVISLAKNTVRVSLEDSYVGIGGFYSQLENSSVTGIFSRNTGFFSEPTNFGQFLIVPLFLSAQKTFYSKEKNKKNVAVFSIILLAFLLTFSVANFFGLFIGLIIFSLVRMNNKYYKGKSRMVYLTQIFIFIGILYGSYQFYNLTNSFNRTENIVGKNTNSNIDNRIWRNNVYFQRIIEKPFGDIDYKNDFGMATGMIGNIAIVGGYPLLILVMIFLVNYLRKIFFWAKNSRYLLIYIGLFSYFPVAIWDAHLYEYQFIFILVFYSTLLKYDKHNFIVI